MTFNVGDIVRCKFADNDYMKWLTIDKDYVIVEPDEFFTDCLFSIVDDTGDIINIYDDEFVMFYTKEEMRSMKLKTIMKNKGER